MPLQATSGAASYDAFGGGVPVVPTYIEDVFSDYLFSGTSASNTINNGIDASGKGALVWIKDRGAASTPHMWFDTTRGVGKYIQSNSTGSEGNIADTLTAFNSNGFTLGADSFGVCNASGHNYVSWMFREAPKFFDVVTFTSSASGNKTFSHALGSVPGCVIIKNTQTNDPWIVYHRSVGDNAYLSLNSTAAQDPLTGAFSATSTTFTISSSLMYNSQSYVAYLFAHNAGGFGLTGTDNVISCGSYTGNGSTSGPSITLGYEPQWILTKNATSSGWDWNMFDNMRGLPVGSGELALQANLSDAESGTLNWIDPTATGFNITSSNAQINQSGSTILYIAIRRGPMKVPTSGTSVFSPNASSAATNTAITTNFPIDLQIQQYRSGSGANWYDRLRGISTNTTASGQELGSAYTGGESATTGTRLWGNTGFTLSSYTSGAPFIYWNFKRAPSTFDEVCFTPTGVAQTITHNLGVAPELIIGKTRDAAFNWYVYAAPLGNTQALYLNTTDTPVSGQYLWNNTSPTASVFSVGTGGINTSAATKSVAYLWATNAGVTKVGSYTGNGSSQTINCGFTSGSRMVLIIRTDASGDRYIWDSARGIVSGNDPHLSLNSTAAEVTTDDTIDTDSTGFIVNQVSATNCNVNGASYIFLSYA